MPASTVVPVGAADKEKSAKKIDNDSVALCAPLVPVTVKFNGLAVVEDKLFTVKVLDCPAGTLAGLKLHVAPLLQDNATEFNNVLGPATETVKVELVVPMRTTLERVLAERLNSAIPVPDRLTAAVFTAFDETSMLPVTAPVEVGAKLTVIVQACPTFSVAGTVGKFVPQLLVSGKPPELVMLVIVTD